MVEIDKGVPITERMAPEQFPAHTRSTNLRLAIASPSPTGSTFTSCGRSATRRNGMPGAAPAGTTPAVSSRTGPHGFGVCRTLNQTFNRVP